MAINDRHDKQDRHDQRNQHDQHDQHNHDETRRSSHIQLRAESLHPPQAQSGGSRVRNRTRDPDHQGTGKPIAVVGGENRIGVLMPRSSDHGLDRADYTRVRSEYITR